MIRLPHEIWCIIYSFDPTFRIYFEFFIKPFILPVIIMDASFQKKEQSIKFNQNDYWQNHFLSGIIFDRLDGMIMAYVHIRKNMIYESCASVYYGKENAQIVMMRNKSSLMKKWYIGPSEQVRFEKLMSDRIKNYH